MDLLRCVSVRSVPAGARRRGRCGGRAGHDAGDSAYGERADAVTRGGAV